MVNIVGDGSRPVRDPVNLGPRPSSGFPILYIIPANHEYAILKLKEFADQLDTPGVPGLDFPGFEFVSLAKGYGYEGRRIVRPEDLEPALREALAMDSPYFDGLTVLAGSRDRPLIPVAALGTASPSPN